MITSEFITNYFYDKGMTENDVKKKTVKYGEFIKYFFDKLPELDRYEAQKESFSNNRGFKNKAEEAFKIAKENMINFFSNHDEIKKAVEKISLSVTTKPNSIRKGDKIELSLSQLAYWLVIIKDVLKRVKEDDVLFHASIFVAAHEMSHVIDEKVRQATGFDGLKRLGSEPFADTLAWCLLKETKYGPRIKRYVESYKLFISKKKFEKRKALFAFVKQEIMISKKAWGAAAKSIFINKFDAGDQRSAELVLKNMAQRHGFNISKFPKLKGLFIVFTSYVTQGFLNVPRYSIRLSCPKGL